MMTYELGFRAFTWEQKQSIHVLLGKFLGKRLLGSPGRKWDCNRSLRNKF